MKTLEITQEEKYLLKKHFNKSEIELVRLKAQAVVMFSQGHRYKVIGAAMFRAERTVRRWIEDFEKQRLASIFSGKEGNENAAKLTRKQKEEISRVLQEKVTEGSILPKKFWDVEELKKYVSVRFGVVYESERSYHFLLKLGELSFKYPDAFNRRRDEELIQKRMEEIRREVTEYMKDDKWEVLTSDETGIQEKNLVKRAWLKKGKKTVVKISMEKERRNFIGFLNQKSKDFSCYEISGGNQEEMIRTIWMIRKKYKKKKICIVWDNAGFHKGEKIRKELRKGGKLENIHFINLPPYAPEYNPVEHVWNTAKAEVSKYRSKTIDEIARLFRVITHDQKFNYEL